MAATVILKGNSLTLKGQLLRIGDYAPEVHLIDRQLNSIRVGGAQDLPQILITVPSLDTPICATEIQKFNSALAELSKQKKFLAVVASMDLPFAQNRYCESHNIDRIIIASDFRYGDFEKYGVVLAEGPLAGILARAVFVVNPQGKITYTELVHEITNEPNYEAALKALRDV